MQGPEVSCRNSWEASPERTGVGGGQAGARSCRTSEEAKVKGLDFIQSRPRRQWNVFRQGNYMIWLLCGEVEQDSKQ